MDGGNPMTTGPRWALGSSAEEPPTTDEPDFGWRLSSLPPCRLCTKPIMVAQWITSDGVHHACAEQYPDAMFGHAEVRGVTP